MSATANAKTRELFGCLLLSLILGIFVCSVSRRMLNRDARRAEAIEMELAILHGQEFHESGNLTTRPPFQNRVLFPLLLASVSKIGLLSLARWYTLLRLGSAVAMFAMFWYVLRNQAQATPKLAAAGLLLLAYCLVFTFSLPLVLTSDFPDAMFTIGFVALAVQKRRWLLLLLSVIAAANRESSAFAGVIWIALFGVDRKLKFKLGETAYGLLVAITSYTAVVLLRYGFGGAKALTPGLQAYTLSGNLTSLAEFFKSPFGPFSWLTLNLCMIGPAILWIGNNRRALTQIHKRLLIAAGALAVGSALFGIATEPRIFIPSVALLVYVAVGAEADSGRLSQELNEAAR